MRPMRASSHHEIATASSSAERPERVRRGSSSPPSKTTNFRATATSAASRTVGITFCVSHVRDGDSEQLDEDEDLEHQSR